MRVLDLTFTNGKACRCIVMEPGDPSEDEAGIREIFQGRLESITARLPPCPAKLPWQRAGDVWRLHSFGLRRDGDQWSLTWPGGSFTGASDEVSQTVRNNWVDVLVNCVNN